MLLFKNSRAHHQDAPFQFEQALDSLKLALQSSSVAPIAEIKANSLNTSDILDLLLYLRNETDYNDFAEAFLSNPFVSEKINAEDLLNALSQLTRSENVDFAASVLLDLIKNYSDRIDETLLNYTLSIAITHAVERDHANVLDALLTFHDIDSDFHNELVQHACKIQSQIGRRGQVAQYLHDHHGLKLGITLKDIEPMVKELGIYALVYYFYKQAQENDASLESTYDVLWTGSKRRLGAMEDEPVTKKQVPATAESPYPWYTAQYNLDSKTLLAKRNTPEPAPTLSEPSLPALKKSKLNDY